MKKEPKIYDPYCLVRVEHVLATGKDLDCNKCPITTCEYKKEDKDNGITKTSKENHNT